MMILVSIASGILVLITWPSGDPVITGESVVMAPADIESPITHIYAHIQGGAKVS